MKKMIILVSGSLIAAVFMLPLQDSTARTDARTAEVMQKHIAIVKQKNPKQYKDMVDAAGGNIVDCMSCHHAIFDNQKSRQRPSPR